MKIYTNDLVKGHSDFKVKCLTFGLYTQVSDSGPLGPLVLLLMENPVSKQFRPDQSHVICHLIWVCTVLPITQDFLNIEFAFKYYMSKSWLQYKLGILVCLKQKMFL